MARRKEYEDDDFLDEEIDEEIEEEEDEQEVDESDEEGSDVDSEEEVDEASEAEEADEGEVEEEEVYPPDDQKAVAALKKLRVRLDVNEQGNVWRAIFDDTNGKDQALVLLSGLPALKELWLIGTKVTPEAAKEIKEERPKMTVYY